MLVGMLRTKIAAIWYDAELVGAFGLATLMQSMILAISIAGVITAGRVGISDGAASQTEIETRTKRLLLRPAIAGTGIVAVLMPFSPWLANIIFADDAYVYLVIAVLLGVPAIAFSQSALAIVQVNGSVREMFRCVLVFVVIGSLAIVLLGLTDSSNKFAYTFALTPILQCITFVMFSPTIRMAIKTPLVGMWQKDVTTPIARVSLIMGALIMASDLYVRAHLSNTKGLFQVALLQPPQMLVNMGFSLATVSITQVIMVHLNQNENRDDLVFVKGPWKEAITYGVFISGVAIAVSIYSQQAIRIWFSEELLYAAPLLSIAATGEILRGIAWIAGCTILPQGRWQEWATIQLSWIFVFIVSSFIFMPQYGAKGIVLAVLCRNLTELIATVAVLRPTMEAAVRIKSVMVLAIAFALFISGMSDSVVWALCAVPILFWILLWELYRNRIKVRTFVNRFGS